MISRKSLLIVLFLLCLSASLRLSTKAQIRTTYDKGEIAVVQLLKQLNTAASALMIGAHPDDEDTALLAYLARGENARTAYLSLTRGDGGQNIIGPELGEALGVIRTEELLQARKLDGAEQFFGRAYDYGFSKTLAEAKQKWDEKIVLCDVVRVIRNYRPLVVISQFSGTPADGHGQHQFAGYITPLAVKAAADAGQCAEAGPSWEVRKFYARHRGTGNPTLRVNTGEYQHLYGRSLFEIAMEARSQHRSQEQGVLELKGAQFSSLNLVDEDVKDDSVFDRVDTSITGIARNAADTDPAVRQALETIQEVAVEAINYHHERTPQRIIDLAVKGYKVAGSAERASTNPHTKHQLGIKRSQFLELIKRTAGIQIDALADRETVVPGETVNATVRVFLYNTKMVKPERVVLTGPTGWSIKTVGEPAAGNQPAFRREVADHNSYFEVSVPASAKYTQPYWLEEARSSDLFTWSSNETSLTRPFRSPVAFAEVTVTIGGSEITFTQPVEFRFADDTRGEVRRDLSVVPRIAVGLDQDSIVIPYSDRPQTRRVVLTVINNGRSPVSGTVALNAEATKSISSSAQSTSFDLKRAGERGSFPFTLNIPARTKPGTYRLSGKATVDGAVSSTSMNVISYPHIQTHRIYRPAETSLVLVDLKTAPVKVGYITGSGDKVDDAIRQIGFETEEIDERVLAAGDLSKFDTIVVGIRAYQVRPDVVANNKRLLDFVNNGGTLIVQYQLPPTFSQPNLTPYPTQMGPRTSDENAPVTILEPAHPLFNFPNKITAEDFRGWVQERNLYNFSNMDPKYVGLLESHDAGEAENKGGLVIAEIGKGKYIYCSYSLFRQLPAGVPGAYRLLANMLSLPKAK